MGTRETAYLKYLSGDNTSLTEKDIDLNELNQFQRMAQIGANNAGALTYDKYPTDGSNNEAFRHTVGRTGKGQIRRDGNTWIVNDTYNFNGADTSLWDKAKYMANAFLQGNPLAALARGSTLVGSEYKTDIRVPMTPEQITATGGTLPYNNNNTMIGGQKYEWQPHKLQQGENFESIAKQSFADNKYKAEGNNLANYTAMIEKQNKGNYSNIIYRPVKR